MLGARPGGAGEPLCCGAEASFVPVMRRVPVVQPQ